MPAIIIEAHAEAFMLQRIFVFVALLALAVTTAAQPMPQTARQALIEMFFGKATGSFEKHLPEATLAAIHKAQPGSAGSMVSLVSMLSTQAHSTSHIESFEAGATLFTTEDPQTHSKLEAIVERDDLNGETDQIELSFRAYKDGQLQTAGLDPRLVIDMRPENKTWRLHDVKFSIGISLTDPNFLKLLDTPIKPPVTNTASTQMQGGPAVNLGSMRSNNETSAAASIRTINTAQMTYATSYPAHGFTCTLSDLGGMGGGGGADEHHALLLEPRLSNGRKSGYVFRLSNCNGTPASTYSVTAVPADVNAGARAFCSDQSGVVRYSQDGNADSCLRTGLPLQ